MMKHSDFQVGAQFYTATGQVWRCTDVGNRTILAIELNSELDSHWFKGPPYAVEEIVFDETKIKSCYQDHNKHLQDISENLKASKHSAYPSKHVFKMLKAEPIPDDYPNQKLLNINRVDEEGQVYHPYAVVREGEEWMILVYLPSTEEFIRIKESDFIKFS